MKNIPKPYDSYRTDIDRFKVLVGLNLALLKLLLLVAELSRFTQ